MIFSWNCFIMPRALCTDGEIEFIDIVKNAIAKRPIDPLIGNLHLILHGSFILGFGSAGSRQRYIVVLRPPLQCFGKDRFIPA